MTGVVMNQRIPKFVDGKNVAIDEKSEPVLVQLLTDLWAKEEMPYGWTLKTDKKNRQFYWNNVRFFIFGQ